MFSRGALWVGIAWSMPTFVAIACGESSSITPEDDEPGPFDAASPDDDPRKCHGCSDPKAVPVRTPSDAGMSTAPRFDASIQELPRSGTDAAQVDASSPEHPDAGNAWDAAPVDEDGGSQTQFQDAVVAYNLAPNAMCEFVFGPSGIAFYPGGLYDVRGGGNAESNACAGPYVVNLLLRHASMPDGADRRTIIVKGAEIRLRLWGSQELLVFDQGPEALPNPISASASGVLGAELAGSGTGIVVGVEAIPWAYAAQLERFVDQQIIAEIQLSAVIEDGSEARVSPLVYPIDICEGCMTVCETVLRQRYITHEELTRGTCADNSGADGRWCIDEGC